MSETTRPRNGFLDVVRAVALVRVILWHAFASPALSWTVTSMPTMFFVAGSLFAQGLDRRPARELVPQRARRLLVPFWVFAGAVLVLLAIVHRLDPSAATTMSPAQLMSWIIPVADPHGSAWEGGWLSTPLWYLRCYLWLLVLAPLLRRAFRRVGWWTIVPMLVILVAVDAMVRRGSGPMFGARWYIGDVAVYGVFVVLGFAHHEGRLAAIPRRDLIEWACVALVAGIVWTRLVNVPGNVVNNSYPLLLIVGFAWLCAFLAAAPLLTSLAERRFSAPVVAYLGRRSLTIYLWHSAAIVAAYWARGRFFPSMSRWTILPLVAVGVVALSTIAGPVEDLAAGRSVQWWPRRSSRSTVRVVSPMRRMIGAHTPRIAAGMVVGAAVVSFVVVPSPSVASSRTDAEPTAPASGGLGLPPAPSAKPTVADFGSASSTDAAAPDGSSAVTTTVAAPAAGNVASTGIEARVLEVVQNWATEHGVAGVRLGVSLVSGERLIVDSGSAVSGDPQPVTSITKTMTAAIILQLVDEGRIALDDPLPPLAAVPDSPFPGHVTIRQLLDHTAGVTPYADTAAWAASPSTVLTPQTALALAATEPLQWAPGTTGGYSNSGYLLLGLLIEQLTSMPYAQALQTRLFDPSGMTGSSLDERPSAGWIGFSAGGVLSTVDDLLSWGQALYRDHAVLSDSSLTQMLDVDNPFSAGLGAFPVCPCTRVDGAPVYTSIGHQGGQATVQWSPDDDLVVAALFSESMWTDHLSQQDVAGLLASVRTAVAGG